MRACIKCGAKVFRHTAVHCRPCYNETRPRQEGKPCSGCGKSMYYRTKGTLCLSCFNKSGAKRAASSVKMKVLRNTPEEIERLRELGHSCYHKGIGRPDVLARTQTPEMIAERARAASKTKLEKRGVPPGYREMYLRVLHRKNMRAVDAVAIVRKQARLDEIARLTVLHVTEAADFLRKFAPVSRRDDGWRYGNTILTSEEIIERAQLRGWQPFELVRAA